MGNKATHLKFVCPRITHLITIMPIEIIKE